MATDNTCRDCGVGQLPYCSTLSEWYDCYADNGPSLSLLMRGLTVLFRVVFSEASNNLPASSGIECLTYDPDPTKSRLGVTSSAVLDPADDTKAPKIIIDAPEGISYQKLSINGYENQVSEDTSRITHTMLGETTLTVECREHDPSTALALSDVVVNTFLSGYRTIQQAMPWIASIEIGTQSKASMHDVTEGGTTKYYASTVAVKFIIEKSVTTALESSRLKAITINPKTT